MVPFPVAAEAENHFDLQLSVAWVLRLLKYLQLIAWGVHELLTNVRLGNLIY